MGLRLCGLVARIILGFSQGFLKEPSNLGVQFFCLGWGGSFRKALRESGRAVCELTWDLQHWVTRKLEWGYSTQQWRKKLSQVPQNESDVLGALPSAHVARYWPSAWGLGSVWRVSCNCPKLTLGRLVEASKASQ